MGQSDNLSKIAEFVISDSIGGITIGSPTGGSQGSGTINTKGFFVDGVDISSGLGASGDFSASEAGTPDMTVVIGAGNLYNGTSLTIVSEQTTTAITAPTTNPRIDRIVINSSTGVYSIITGTEAASPVPPAISGSIFPICQIALSVGQTSILNTDITDERVFNGGGGAGGSTAVFYEYTLTEGQTVITGVDDNTNILSYVPGLILVSHNGSQLANSDFTAVDGTNITLNNAGSLNDTISILSFGTFDIANAYTKAESDAIFTNIPSRNIVLNQPPLTQPLSTRTGQSSTIYTGNGTSQSIVTGVDMATGTLGGLVWVKDRVNGTTSHHLWDTVRGVGNGLQSDTTVSEGINNGLTSFDTTGFTVGSSTSANASGNDIVAWSFQTTKKKEPTYGSELITNGTFDTDTTGWIAKDAGSGLSVVGQALRITNNDASQAGAYQDITVVIGETYQLSFDAVNLTTSNVNLHVGSTSQGSDIINAKLYTTLSTHTVSFVATTTTASISFEVVDPISTDYIEVDNVTVKQVTNDAKTNRGKPYTAHYNPDMNFSIVGYEGDSVDGHEIPHHLGVVPELSIFKSRDDVASWIVQSSLFNYSEYLFLDSTNALATAGGTGTLFNPSTVRVDTNTSLNSSNSNIISYHFASKSGVCKIGKYIGTGVAGNYVSTEVDGGDAFKPSFVMIKKLSNTGNWVLEDSIRGDNYLFANASDAEVAFDRIDYVDNGFVHKGSSGDNNALNDEYLFIAFAETNSDASKAWADYSYPTTADTLTIENNTLVSVANGFNSAGQVDTQYQFGVGKTHTLGAGFEDKKLYVYTDKLGNIGTTEVRPLTGLTRNDADKYGVVSPSDITLRTTSKHFDYESDSGVALASGELTTYLAWKAFNKDSNDILVSGEDRWIIASTTNSWLQYKHTEPRILKSWRMREGTNAAQTPENFTIEGSNDGLNWTAIDSTYTTGGYQAGAANGIQLWGNLQSTSGNTTAYLYHRINITLNNGDVSNTQIAELELNTIIAADYYLVEEGKMYNSSGVPIERVYLGEVLTDSNGDVASYINYPVNKQQITEAEVHGDLTVYGEINSWQTDDAYVIFDSTQNPPLILAEKNVADVVDTAVGKPKIIFKNKMDRKRYNVDVLCADTLYGSVNLVGSDLFMNERDFTLTIRNYLGTLLDSGFVAVRVSGGKEIK